MRFRRALPLPALRAHGAAPGPRPAARADRGRPRARSPPRLRGPPAGRRRALHRPGPGAASSACRASGASSSSCAPPRRGASTACCAPCCRRRRDCDLASTSTRISSSELARRSAESRSGSVYLGLPHAVHRRRFRGAARRPAAADRGARGLSRRAAATSRRSSSCAPSCARRPPRPTASCRAGRRPWWRATPSGPTRSTTSQYLFTDWVELHGDRALRRRPRDRRRARHLPRPLGRWSIGHQKGRGTKERIVRNFGQPRPEGYRKALRVMRLAERFGLPVLSLRRHARRLSRASTPRSAARPRRSPAT